MVSLLDLDEKQRPASSKRFLGSAQHFELGAFDIDLHEFQIAESERVELLELDLEGRVAARGCAKAGRG